MSTHKLPKPNVRYQRLSESAQNPDGIDDDTVRGMICNPIFAGLPHIPAMIEDDAWVEAASPGEAAPQGRKAQHRVVPVIYDGPDLGSVAKRLGWTIAALIEAHRSPTYTVRMNGFAPGFPYLDGLDPRLHLPRRENPRTRIAPGSVAIGGPHAGIYPIASPGGWHLLGRTEFPLFEPEAAQGSEADPRKVFPLQTGDTVRFEAIGGRGHA